MEVRRGGIIKGQSVRMVASAALAEGSAPCSGGPVETTDAQSSGPRARLIAGDGNSAVIEVVCACGEVIRLQCQLGQ